MFQVGAEPTDRSLLLLEAIPHQRKWCPAASQAARGCKLVEIIEEDRRPAEDTRAANCRGALSRAAPVDRSLLALETTLLQADGAPRCIAAGTQRGFNLIEELEGTSASDSNSMERDEVTTAAPTSNTRSSGRAEEGGGTSEAVEGGAGTSALPLPSPRTAVRTGAAATPDLGVEERGCEAMTSRDPAEQHEQQPEPGAVQDAHAVPAQLAQLATVLPHSPTDDGSTKRPPSGETQTLPVTDKYLERLHSLVTDGSTGLERVVPDYEWIQGSICESDCFEETAAADVARKESNVDGEKVNCEMILNHKTIATRFLEELRARNDLTGEEREIIESIRGVAMENASDDDVRECESERNPVSHEGASISDSEDEKDVVVGALRDFVHDKPSFEKEVPQEVEQQHINYNRPKTTNQEPQKIKMKGRESKMNSSAEIKILLDQHAGIMCMPLEERQILTNQLSHYLKELENKRGKKRRKPKRLLTIRSDTSSAKLNTETKECSNMIREESVEHNPDDKLTIQEIISESDDEQADTIIRKVSCTLEMQIASEDS